MSLIYSDIFTVFGLFTAVSVFIMGFVLNFGGSFYFKPLIFLTVYILLTASMYVSYKDRQGIKIELLVLCLLILIIIWMIRIDILSKSLPILSDGKRSFTNISYIQWQIQPAMKLGIEENGYVLCILSDNKLCASVKVPNLLFYQSYSLCNIEGDLFYKDVSLVKTYDYLKKTFLNGFRLGLECQPTWISKIFDFRDFIIAKISSILPRPQSTLLSGIIFGINVAFYPKFDNAIRAAGISHVVAASGYNVNILISALSPLTSKLGKRLGILVNIFSIWFYALLTGFSSSMVRACAMSSVLFLEKFFDLRIEGKKIFLLTIAILVFLNPFIMFDLGFLLSAAATYGVIYLSPVVEELIPNKWFPHSTFACTLATLPVTIFFFNTLSPYSILANMLILPVIEIVMLLGVFGLIIKPLLYLAWGCLRYVEIVALNFSKLPFSIIDIPENYSIVISILVVVLIYFIQNHHKYKFNINNH